MIDMAKETISIRLDSSVITELGSRATKEGRTLSSYVSRLLTAIVYDVNIVNIVNDVNDSAKPVEITVEQFRQPDVMGQDRSPLPNFPLVWLSGREIDLLQTYWAKRGLEQEFFDEPCRFLNIWFSNNPDKHTASKCHANSLYGWPLQRALESQGSTHKSRKVNPSVVRGVDRVGAIKNSLQGALNGNQRECFEVDVLHSNRVSTVRDTRRETTALVRASRRVLPGATEERSRLFPSHEPEPPSAVLAAIDCSDKG